MTNLNPIVIIPMSNRQRLAALAEPRSAFYEAVSQLDALVVNGNLEALATAAQSVQDSMEAMIAKGNDLAKLVTVDVTVSNGQEFHQVHVGVDWAD